MRTRIAALTAVACLSLLAGCTFREAICSDGEYPVQAVNSTTGRACVPDGEAPPAGYVKYPEGKVPQYVDDEWDTYWHEHQLDENGQEVA